MKKILSLLFALSLIISCNKDDSPAMIMSGNYKGVMRDGNDVYNDVLLRVSAIDESTVYLEFEGENVPAPMRIEVKEEEDKITDVGPRNINGIVLEYVISSRIINFGMLSIIHWYGYEGHRI